MAWHYLYQKLTALLPQKTSAQLTRKSIERQLKVLIQQQYADAAKKREAVWHWGNNGNLVHYATERCENILAWQANENLNDYFTRVLPAMSALAESYRRDSSDHDGYALGTVRELEEAIKIKARVCGVLC